MMGVAVMKEKLERLKVRQTNLVVEIKGLARDIMDRINPAMVDDIVDMKVPEAAAWSLSSARNSKREVNKCGND